ncbi:hypothetical protein F5884DRAFT_863187 [Xylogone sp. PMI_703]|nr:hypothetical protein F5884DRAFT_863187 [Xylogone sp. PMI_703]
MNSSVKAELHRYVNDAAVDVETRQQRITEIRDYLDTMEEGLQRGNGRGAPFSEITGLQVPPRTLRNWTPVISSKGDLLMWNGEDYRHGSVETGQNLVKALAKVQFLVTWNCTFADMTQMCPELINPAGGPQEVETLLRSHVAKLRHRAKANASKLLQHLQRHHQGTSLGSLWGLEVALVLFGHLASAIDIEYIVKQDTRGIVGKWCSFYYQDLVEHFTSSGNVNFLDKMPERAMEAGVECASADRVPLTQSLLFLTRASGRALTALTIPVPISVDEPVE